MNIQDVHKVLKLRYLCYISDTIDLIGELSDYSVAFYKANKN